MADGARANELSRLRGEGLTTKNRWRRQFAGEGDGVDCRKGSHRHVVHRLSEENTPADPTDLQRARIRGAADRPDRAIR